MDKLFSNWLRLASPDITAERRRSLEKCVTDGRSLQIRWQKLPEPFGAAYLKVGEVRDGVDSDLAGWGRGGLSYRGRPGRTI